MEISFALTENFFGTAWVVMCMMLAVWIIRVIAAWVVLLIRRKEGK